MRCWAIGQALQARQPGLRRDRSAIELRMLRDRRVRSY
jgi:hypothetical protein